MECRRKCIFASVALSGVVIGKTRLTIRRNVVALEQTLD